jgi:hypothetical protein
MILVTTKTLRLASILSGMILLSASFATFSLADDKGPSVGIKDVPTQGDTSIVIKKGAPASQPHRDFEVESGTEEITGDPAASAKEAMDSWKQACAEWKKEMGEMNAGQLLALSCGTPRAEKDKNFRTTQSSTGTYKVKVKVKSEVNP